MNRSRGRHGDARQEDCEDPISVLLEIAQANNGMLKRLLDMAGSAKRTATRRSNALIEEMKMKTKDMMQRLVTLQTSLTSSVTANESLLTKLVAEIRKAGDESEHEMPPEVTDVLNGIEANITALATATAVGTEAVPSNTEIPPVVEPPVGGSEGLNTENT